MKAQTSGEIVEAHVCRSAKQTGGWCLFVGVNFAVAFVANDNKIMLLSEGNEGP